MLRSGWNMPPGVHRIPGDEPVICLVCLKSDDDCICPECPRCGAQGNPMCYEEPKWVPGNKTAQNMGRKQRAARRETIEQNVLRHSMRLNKEQVMVRLLMIKSRAEAKVKEADLLIKLLQKKKWPPERPQDMGEEVLSDELEAQFDPFTEVRLIYE